MKLKPLGNRIIVEPVKRPRSDLIVTPEAYTYDDKEFRIVAIGSGRLLKNGRREPIQVEVGWRVVSNAYSARHLEYGDQKLRIIDMADVLMVLPP